MKILITGGSGFVGTALSRHFLEKGAEVSATGTSAAHSLSDRENFTYIQADTTRQGEWQDALQQVDLVINLAGRNIFKRWTRSYKKQIYDSRILTTRNLVSAFPERKEIVFFSASAAGYYGNRGDEILTEDTTSGKGFLSTVCVDWEKEAFKAKEKGIRVIAARLGVVLGKDGGALEKMIPAFRFFVGGPLGDGKHWFPWIHIDDLFSAILFLLEKPEIDGPVNFCSPGSIRYEEFAGALGSALKRPSFFKTPAFVIKTIMGELGEALLDSQRSVPEKLRASGFQFQFPEIQSALSSIL
ncbi:MAG: TIGR01777 family oxidoreductase [Desulfobacterales bacterium]